MTYKIKPIIVGKKNMHEIYKELLDKKYQLKIWKKSKDKEVYNYFLPVIRDYMFWTFNLNEEQKFKSMDNEMQSAICNNYSCNIFEKKENVIICFNTGVIFVIGNEEIDEKYTLNIEDINIPKDKVYNLSVDNECDLYNYIINLYKFITLKQLDSKMGNKDLFYKNRKAFVKFIQNIYTKKITDDNNGCKLQEKWQKELELDNLYLSVENKFDLLYRNNRLDNKENLMKIIIVLLIVIIIIGIINLGNML